MEERLQDPEKVARARNRLHSSATEAGLERIQRVFCEPVRLRIIRALGAEPLSVSDLAAVIDRRVQATSQHLRVLRQLGVVERQRQGRHVYYRLSPTVMVNQLQGMLDSVEQTVA